MDRSHLINEQHINKKHWEKVIKTNFNEIYFQTSKLFFVAGRFHLTGVPAKRGKQLPGLFFEYTHGAVMGASHSKSQEVF